MIFAGSFYHILMQSPRFAGKGRKRHATITPVYIDHGGHRSDPMRRVEVAVAVYRMMGTPAGFRECFIAKFRPFSNGFFPVIEFYTAQIMLVSSLQVNN